jgi:hypothetical protein
LFQVVPGVNEVESAPLRRGQGAEYLVSGKALPAELPFALDQEIIHGRQFFAERGEECCGIQLPAGYGRGHHYERSVLTWRKVAHLKHGQAAQTVVGGDRRLSRATLFEALTKCRCRTVEREDQMLDDLSRIPTVGVAVRVPLKDIGGAAGKNLNKLPCYFPEGWVHRAGPFRFVHD